MNVVPPIVFKQLFFRCFLTAILTRSELHLYALVGSASYDLCSACAIDQRRIHFVCFIAKRLDVAFL
jgi:hypothetical protein